jgi:hypothetical protein
MKKSKFLTIALLATTIIVSTLLIVTANEMPAEYSEVIVRPFTTGYIEISQPTTDSLGEKIPASPTGYYQYQDIGGTLNPSYRNDYGPNEPYSVSVKINSVTPSGYKVTVSIRVNGATQWAGALGAGQSSPTITCSGGTTNVRVTNDNDVQVSYSGRISWYFN